MRPLRSISLLALVVSLLPMAGHASPAALEGPPFQCFVSAADGSFRKTFIYDGKTRVEVPVPGYTLELQPYDYAGTPVHRVTARESNQTRSWTTADFESGATRLQLFVGNAATGAALRCFR